MIDDDGIHFLANRPKQSKGWSLVYPKDWSTSWNEIKSVRIQKPNHTQREVNRELFELEKTSVGSSATDQLVLELDMGSKHREIFLCQWVDTKEPFKKLCQLPSIQSWKIENNKKNQQFLYQHPLVKAITQRGFSVKIDPNIKLSTPFFMSFDSYSRLVAICALLVFFFFVMQTNTFYLVFGETYTNSPFMLGSPFIKLNLIIGFIAMGLFIIWTYRAKIPIGHSWIAGFIVGLAVFSASPATTIFLTI